MSNQFYSTWLNPIPRLLGWLGLILMCFASNAFAGQVTLAWDPSSSSDVGGYHVVYGQSSGTYTAEIDVGNQTSTTVANLDDSKTYYFAVRAYNADKTIKSANSNEVSKPASSTTSQLSTKLPSPWINMDIGNVGLVGSANYVNGTFTVNGSGGDIWGSADAFHFVYQPLTGDGSIVARMASLSNTNAWAKAGVMIRENLDANASHALVTLTPGNGIRLIRRTSTGGSSSVIAGGAVEAPYWVKLTRTGNTFIAYQSADGGAWTQIGSAITISMGANVYIGLAVTSHDNSTLNTSVLDNVSVSTGNTNSGSSALSLQGWDIGNVGLVGNTAYANGTYTIKGSGGDIWGSADAFHFAYQPLTGDGSIVARVASLSNTNAWAKVGVMIRENLDANASHALVTLTPSNGIRFIRRTSTGGSSSVTAGGAVEAPYWVKLTRTGNTFIAYQSINGSIWTQVGSAIIDMATSVYVGLAVTSHDTSLLNTATLDNVKIMQ